MKVQYNIHRYVLWKVTTVLIATSVGSGSESGSIGSVFFGPPGSGYISQRYGSGSGSGSFYHQAKMLCDFFLTLSLKNDLNVP
jgi:hypothetical protein